MSDVRDSTRKRLAAVPLPQVTAAECIRVLVKLGWIPYEWDDRRCIFERGKFRIEVPLQGALGGAQLASFLEGAGVPLFTFVDELDQLRTAGMNDYADRMRVG